MSILILCFTVTLSFAQKGDSKKKEEKKDKTISEFVKEFKKIEGLFPMYQNQKDGTLYLEIDNSDLTKEFIHFTYSENGVTGAAHFRGQYRGSKIFTINKHFNKIEFVQENTDYYFDPENALSKAKDANISKAILTSHKIEASNKEKSKFLINADDLFLNEDFEQVKPSYSPKYKGYKLGSLSKTKTKYSDIRNYPKNTDIIVDYVYENKSPTELAGEGATDSRYITIKTQHSFISMPENNYKPRFDDPRVGYFMTQVTDLTSTSTTPYKDIIHRWNLEKKDPSADVSDPVKPITWWIENTTPLQLRETIKNAVLGWNSAFEQAGFKNAIEVKIQPDNADWEAGDIRYNVLRWTSSPNPPFGGYGPSFVNPRTGEILGADIMLEYISLTNRLKYGKVFDGNSDSDISNQKCIAGQLMQQANLFGLAALNQSPSLDIENNPLIKQSLIRLLLHEVGHTLGLNHNMKSSQLLSPEELKDSKIVDKKGLCGSVMEYPSINFALNKNEQTLFYDVKPGPYDLWAIEFGYSVSLQDEKDEFLRLEKILSRSTEPELMFGNDADDMRAPGKGLDPRVNVYDLSNDPMTYSTERIMLINKIAKELKEKFTEHGRSYNELRFAYNVLMREYGTHTNIMTRFIGGIHVDRSIQGQNGAIPPFIPVSEKEQKRAMALLSDVAFSPRAFEMPNKLYPYLQYQRRGFNHWEKNEDPHIHNKVLSYQKRLLDHLLHANVLRRLTDTKLYGNTYSASEFITDLSDAMFKEDMNKDHINSMRRNLQIEYTKRLLVIIESKSYDYNAQSVVFDSVKHIEEDLDDNIEGDKETIAHRKYLLHLIRTTLQKS